MEKKKEKKKVVEHFGSLTPSFPLFCFNNVFEIEANLKTKTIAFKNLFLFFEIFEEFKCLQRKDENYD